MGSKIQPTYKRQRFLLNFVSQLEKGIAHTSLQKLVFLSLQKQKSDIYEFIPYQYGAYSFQLADDIDILCKNNFLEKSNGLITQTNGTLDHGKIDIEVERGTPLLRKAYSEYPYYTLNSIILDKLFTGNKLAELKQAKNQYKQTEQVLFTIGYEGKTIENFINNLIKNDIRMLIDVRKNPLSRKFGFSKKKLWHILNEVSIKYYHMPELGIESENRKNLTSEDDYKTLFSAYEKTLINNKPYLETVYNLLVSNLRVALVCYECDPRMCHRNVIKEHIVKHYKAKSFDL